MKLGLTLLTGAALGLVAACAPMHEPADAVGRTVNIAGEVFMIQQLTESTWTASTIRLIKPRQATPASTALLRQAIEKASGCKVTDSDFSLQGRQFDAQVDCVSRRND